MSFTPHVLLLLAALVLLSAAVQGFTGLGFGLVGMAFCTMLVGPRNANVLWTLLALLLVGSMAIRMRRQVAWRLVGWMALGSLVGIPVGVRVLATGSPLLLRRIIGGAIMAFAAYSLVNPRFKKRKIPAAWGTISGTVGGFFGGVTNTSGPPLVIFLLLLGLEKDRMKATLAACFAFNATYKLVVLVAWTGLVSGEHILSAALLGAPLLAGMAGGMYAARFVSTETMRRIICALLMLPALLLLL